MGFFDDIFGQPFGGMFDFNRDGKTDFGEQWLGYKIINDCMKEETKDTYSGSSSFFDSSDDTDDDWRLFCEDGSEYDLDPEDYASEYDYEEALAQAKVAWRDTCEDGFDLGIDPDNYDTEDEYEEALAEARAAWRADCDDGSAYGLDPEDFDTQDEYEDALAEARESSGCGGINIPITLSVSVDIPGYEALSAIKLTDYPNKRQYDAAYHLCDVEQGTAYIPDDSSKEAEIERCKFILAADTVAGKYLTVYDGFLYAQAIKENFKLPVDVQDEDEEVKTFFDDLFLEIAEEDVALALQIWVWCIKEFGPYQKYMKNDWTLYNSVISSVDDYPEMFLDLAIKELGSNISFCQGVLTQNKQFPYGIAQFISRALELDLVKKAQVIFTAVAMNPAAKGKDMENLINSIISDCSNWEELETMERFKFNLLPIIKKMNNKRIQRLLPKFIEQVDYYISSVESSEEKYQYSRKYAWRASCADGTEYDLDPLDYETEEDYNAAIHNEKYGWRRWHSEAKHYGLDVNAYETEDEYTEVLRKKREEERASRAIPKPQADSLAVTDKTIYNFCSVIFSSTNQPYSYLTGDVDVKIGDKVIVPIGHDGTERIAEVVSVSQHRRISAPYPVDRAKKIIGVFTPPTENVECPILNKGITPDECYEISCAECTQGIPGLISYEDIIKNKETCRRCKYHAE